MLPHDTWNQNFTFQPWVAMISRDVSMVSYEERALARGANDFISLERKLYD